MVPMNFIGRSPAPFLSSVAFRSCSATLQGGIRVWLPPTLARPSLGGGGYPGSLNPSGFVLHRETPEFIPMNSIGRLSASFHLHEVDTKLNSDFPSDSQIH